jgi:hypothetical protein
VPTEQELKDAIQAMADRAKARSKGGGGVFSVFNIGTGHIGSEPNNTIAALGKLCEGDKVVNDGPGTGGNSIDNFFGTLQGWGMDDACKTTIEAIKIKKPRRVNMAGHSRGAILCHMIAHELSKDDETKDIEICMIVLDPVHQSFSKHEGGEILKNPKILGYHAIIMEHEDKGKGLMFPFKVMSIEQSLLSRVHYIQMPGKHGSGSQCLTSPVGKVVFELMGGYLRARGTEFQNWRPKTPIEICELFAGIHVENPFDIEKNKRLIFDDSGSSTEHNSKNQGWHESTFREKVLKDALIHNQTHNKTFRFNKPLNTSKLSDYFFNQEHFSYFRSAFPYFFKLLTGPKLNTYSLNAQSYLHELKLMFVHKDLGTSFSSLYVLIKKAQPDARL